MAVSCTPTNLEGREAEYLNQTIVVDLLIRTFSSQNLSLTVCSQTWSVPFTFPKYYLKEMRVSLSLSGSLGGRGRAPGGSIYWREQGRTRAKVLARRRVGVSQDKKEGKTSK